MANCWKKNNATTFGDEWESKSQNLSIYVLEDQSIGSPNMGLWFVKISGKGKHWEKTEKEAIRYANKFMKEHDGC